VVIRFASQVAPECLLSLLLLLWRKRREERLLCRFFAPASLTKKEEGEVESRVMSAEENSKPTWRPSLSFRGQPYRLLLHQAGIMGELSLRILMAADLPQQIIGEKGPSSPGAGPVAPYVIAKCGRAWQQGRPSRSSSISSASGMNSFSWSKDEVLRLELAKDMLSSDHGAELEVQVCEKNSHISSFLSTTINVATGSTALQGGVLCIGQTNILRLLMGESDVLDTWIELQPQGRLHVLVEYEPRGMNPRPGDVLFLESFVRCPTSIVLPPNEPLVAHDVRGSFILAGWEEHRGASSECQGRVRLHRNCVYVIEHLGFVDAVWNVLSVPLDALARTDQGAWVVRKSTPLVNSAQLMLAPLSATLVIAISSFRMAFKTALRGTVSVVNESFSSK
jgi:hypothetical protein